MNLIYNDRKINLIYSARKQMINCLRWGNGKKMNRETQDFLVTQRKMGKKLKLHT